MSAVASLAFVMYPVTDMGRARKFYEDVLGLRQDGLESDVWVEYAVGDATFGIGTFEQLGTPGTATSLALECTNLAEFRARLGEHGVETMEPYETPICSMSTAHDPDGNRIYLHQRKAT